MKSLIVQDYMLKQPLYFTPKQTLAQAVQLLVDTHQIGGPVCDDDHHVIGWLSEKDCLAKLLDETYHCESISHVKDVMHSEALAIEPDMSVLTLAEMAKGNKPKMYPVVEKGKLIGVITRREMLVALGVQLDECFSKHP